MSWRVNLTDPARSARKQMWRELATVTVALAAAAAWSALFFMLFG